MRSFLHDLKTENISQLAASLFDNLIYEPTDMVIGKLHTSWSPGHFPLSDLQLRGFKF